MPTSFFKQRRRAMMAAIAYIIFLMLGVSWSIAAFIDERDKVMVHNISLFLLRGVQDQAFEMAAQFQYKLLGMQSVAQDIIENSGEKLDAASLQRCGDRILADNIFITNESGHIWSQSAVPADLLEKDFYQNVLAGRPAVSPLLSGVEGEDLVVLAIPVIRGSRFLGSLGAIFRSASFTNYFQLTSFLSSDGVILLNADGRVIGGSPSGPKVTQHFLDLYQSHMPSSTLKPGTDTWVSPVTDRQGRTAYLCVGNMPLNDWRVVTLITDKDLSLDLYDRSRVLGNLFLRLGVCFVLTLVFVIIFMRAMFARRMDSLAREASTDPLTGLLNRASFERSVDSCLQKNRQGLLLVFDLDNFKQINDQYGHPVGDAVIRKVGKIMRANLPHNPLLGRLGGDEFLAFLPTFTSTEAAKPALEIFMNAIRTDELLHEYHVTVSMGLSVAPQDGKKFHRLYSCADVALYASKRCGRNRISSYEQVQATPLPSLTGQ